MKKRILILGGRGMLGSILSNFLRKQGHHVDITVSSLSSKKNELLFIIKSIDYTKDLEKILSGGKYDYIINCIAVLRGNISYPDEVANCFLVNSHLPRTLSLLTQKFGYKNIHISTNGVFASGEGMYSDDEIPNDTTLYGITKIAGEVFSNQTLILRTSIIGTDNIRKKGFLEWVISHNSNEMIIGYENVFWNGVTTLTLSNILAFIIEVEEFNPGIIHIAGELVSKKDLMQIISDIYGCNLKIICDASISENRTLAPSLSSKAFQHLIRPLMEQIIDLKGFL